MLFLLERFSNCRNPTRTNSVQKQKQNKYNLKIKKKLLADGQRVLIL